MSMRKPVRPLLVMWVLSIVLIFLALVAVGGGVLLIQDPTGAVLQMETAWLVNTPFVDYFVPGLILFFIFGVGSLFLLYAMWEMPRLAFLASLTRFTREYWAWDFTILLGVVLLVVVAVRLLGGGSGGGPGGGAGGGAPSPAPREDPRARARALLDERYARGEIDTDEYRERRQALDEGS